MMHTGAFGDDTPGADAMKLKFSVNLYHAFRKIEWHDFHGLFFLVNYFGYNNFSSTTYMRLALNSGKKYFFKIFIHNISHDLISYLYRLIIISYSLPGQCEDNWLFSEDKEMIYARWANSMPVKVSHMLSNNNNNNVELLLYFKRKIMMMLMMTMIMMLMMTMLVIIIVVYACV